MPDDKGSDPSLEALEWDTLKWQHDFKQRPALRAHEVHRDFIKQVNDATIANGTLAVRTALLINGGAAAAVLAFVGGLVAQNKIGTTQLTDITSSLMWFTWGVASAAASTGLAYFTNYCIVGTAASRTLTWDHPYIIDQPITFRWNFWARIFQALAISTALASLILFILGMIDMKNSIGRLPIPGQTTATPNG